MNATTELSEFEFKLVRRAGFLDYLESADEASNDPEGSLWIAIANSDCKDILDLVGVIAEETGWDADDSASLARDYWKAAKKLIAVRRTTSTAR